MTLSSAVNSPGGYGGGKGFELLSPSITKRDPTGKAIWVAVRRGLANLPTQLLAMKADELLRKESYLAHFIRPQGAEGCRAVPGKRRPFNPSMSQKERSLVYSPSFMREARGRTLPSSSL